MKKIIYILIVLLTVNQLATAGKKKQEVITKASYGVENQGSTIKIMMQKGKFHNHPLMAIWLADSTGKFIQTLYVAESIGKGYFDRTVNATGKWEAGPNIRLATLPFWAYQRGILNEKGNYMPSQKLPETDAVTGATPPGSFEFTFHTNKILNGKYKVMMEINQSWDWNEFWYNDKFPDDKDYKTSSQPAVIYEAIIDAGQPGAEIQMKPVGRSHHSGQDGKLYTDLSTLTTALNIVKKCSVVIEK